MAIHSFIVTGQVWFDNKERVWLSLEFENYSTEPSSANLSN